MKLEDIDSDVQLIATQTREELEEKFLSVRLKRFEKGVPISGNWLSNWNDYIKNSVRRAVADYLAQNQSPQAQC